MTDADIRRILRGTRVIALVGFSQNPSRPSHSVARFLQRQGYRVIPVNPGLAGQVHLGETVRASLAEVPERIDMIDIFRRAGFVQSVVADALASHPEARVVWMQLGVVNEAAAADARAAGIEVVMDRCPVIESRRLGLAPVG
jgi:predicted CoA-binding protein